MGKDAPMTINEQGAKSAKAFYRFDLLDPHAMFAVTRVLATGAEKYGEDNWRLLGIEDHVNHAIAHLYAWLAGDRTDEHLTNATCRAIFALANELDLKARVEIADEELAGRLAVK